MKKAVITVSIVLAIFLTYIGVNLLYTKNILNNRRIPILFFDNIYYDESLTDYLSAIDHLESIYIIQNLEESKSKSVIFETTLVGCSAKIEAYFQRMIDNYYISSIFFIIDVNQTVQEEMMTYIISSLKDDLSNYDGYYYDEDINSYSIGVNFGATSLSYSIFIKEDSIKIDSYWIF